MASEAQRRQSAQTRRDWRASMIAPATAD